MVPAGYEVEVKERTTMYVVKVRVSGRLSEILTQGCGRFVRTPQGDICVFRSLTVATEVAKLLAGYGLLG